MLKEIIPDTNHPETFDKAHVSHSKTYTTAKGPVFLQSCCSAALVEALQADEGLRAFARLPEREHRLLIDIASKAANRLTVAYTPTGKIVGQVTLVPVDDWWQGIRNAYEIAIEVSSSWRNLGIAHQLLSLALDFDTVEESLILAQGFSWHWDYAGLGISRFQYREFIARLFATHGFSEYLTAEENIVMDPANILVARLGSYLGEESMNQFFERLFRREMSEEL